MSVTREEFETAYLCCSEALENTKIKPSKAYMALGSIRVYVEQLEEQLELGKQDTVALAVQAVRAHTKAISPEECKRRCRAAAEEFCSHATAVWLGSVSEEFFNEWYAENYEE